MGTVFWLLPVPVHSRFRGFDKVYTHFHRESLMCWGYDLINKPKRCSFMPVSLECEPFASHRGRKCSYSLNVAPGLLPTTCNITHLLLSKQRNNNCFPSLEDMGLFWAIPNWTGGSARHPVILVFDPPLICHRSPLSLFQTSYCLGILSECCFLSCLPLFFPLFLVFTLTPCFPFQTTITTNDTMCLLREYTVSLLCCFESTFKCVLG